MKANTIKFFSPEENVQVTKKAKAENKPTGYISGTGKLVLPPKTLEELDIEPLTSRFKIGTQEGKRNLKYLYLIPSSDTEGTFAMTKSGRGFSIPLDVILRKGGVDFEKTKYTFEITLFNYEEGVVGYELALGSSEPKPEYTGKPRGRKPKKDVIEG
ncbi:hypothetical protein DYBT9623_02091 [Dyadobacter sp. CECT 9623]|uniref:Uncharacterized protein n=1 Tax=Dyadobacter linearis TaxID=2823330 RepID=A0ABM8UPF5_9BACT|nr:MULTISPECIES: hypothetical protein [unclassified Dyadobacter]MCE7060609.1 hypothetical protein [Dyadobacter sp. CY343]CAG5069355.1 hypothetical protein DYBT9623_02091 [Dyadobacter sp. CECT 9623]